MKRRDLIGAVTGAAALWPLSAAAQRQEVPVIGYLSSTSAGAVSDLSPVFREGLAQQGYRQDQNVIIKYRWAAGDYSRLPALAAELMNLRPRVIAATGGDPTPIAAKAATTTIPIVFTAGEDPVKLGLVASLSHPGGNLTGATFLTSTLAGKRLQLLHEAAPAATAIGMLINPLNRAETAPQAADAAAAARSLGLSLVVAEAKDANELDQAFATLVSRRVNALLVAADRNLNVAFPRIADLAMRYRMPTCFQELHGPGGLMSYGGDRADAYRQIGVYAGRILKGADPADLPVVQSTKVELVINLQTAQALGLVLPQALLARADKVIE